MIKQTKNREMEASQHFLHLFHSSSLAFVLDSLYYSVFRVVPVTPNRHLLLFLFVSEYSQ